MLGRFLWGGNALSKLNQQCADDNIGLDCHRRDSVLGSQRKWRDQTLGIYGNHPYTPRDLKLPGFVPGFLSQSNHCRPSTASPPYSSFPSSGSSPVLLLPLHFLSDPNFIQLNSLNIVICSSNLMRELGL